MNRRNPRRKARLREGSTRNTAIVIEDDDEEQPELPALVPPEELTLDQLLHNLIFADPQPVAEEEAGVAHDLPAPIPQAEPLLGRASDNIVPPHHAPARLVEANREVPRVPLAPPPGAEPAHDRIINNPNPPLGAPATVIDQHHEAPPAPRAIHPQLKPAFDRVINYQSLPGPAPDVPVIKPSERPHVQNLFEWEAGFLPPPVFAPHINRLSRPTIASARRGPNKSVPPDPAASRSRNPVTRPASASSSRGPRQQAAPPPERARRPPIPVQRRKPPAPPAPPAPPPPQRPKTPTPPPAPPLVTPESPMTINAACIICFEHISNTVLLPCNHLVLCSGCADVGWEMGDAAERCPVCRCLVEKKLVIFRG